ncbi:type IV pilin [Halosimplex halophilum]|uniref:type IV pilin n=1 Tax=Halosimplex halophilum TaxID=2559572 RepID=UPI00107F3BDF|nr:type IV pilin [Halosimplex halophilum]
MTRGPGLVGDERGGVERWVVWLVAVAVVAGLVGSVVYLGDELRRDSPGADFSVAFDAEAGSVTVEHAGGDSISDRTTERLSVVVLDSSAGTSAEVVWVGDSPGATKRGVGYPVAPGDSLTVDDPSVDADGDGNYLDAERSVGFYLESGDSVRVVWTGSMRGTRQSVTLANATLE